MRLRLENVRRLACVLVFTTTLVCSLKPSAWATLAPAAPPPAPSEPASDRASDLKSVQKTLESKVLRHRLHEMGLTDKEIDQRLGKLSDREVHQLATRLHALNPGGDITVIGLLVAVVLILLILYLVKRV